jgi:hypothetical protein
LAATQAVFRFQVSVFRILRQRRNSARPGAIDPNRPAKSITRKVIESAIKLTSQLWSKARSGATSSVNRDQNRHDFSPEVQINSHPKSGLGQELRDLGFAET